MGNISLNPSSESFNNEGGGRGNQAPKKQKGELSYFVFKSQEMSVMSSCFFRNSPGSAGTGVLQNLSLA